jgi:hypothetical protein
MHLGMGTNMYSSPSLFGHDKDEVTKSLPFGELIKKDNGFFSVFTGLQNYLSSMSSIK